MQIIEMEVVMRFSIADHDIQDYVLQGTQTAIEDGTTITCGCCVW